MGEAAAFVRVIEAAGNLSATVLLVIAIWYLFTGRAPTPREYQTSQEIIEHERERSAKKDAEAQAAHERLDRLAETLPEIVDLMESFDKRLDMHGFPAAKPRKRRWPWDRGQA